MNDLAHLELLRHFCPEDLQELEKLTKLVQCPAETRLRDVEGDDDDRTYLIKSGELAIMRKGHVCNILRSGEVFWAGMLSGHERPPLEALARADLTAYAIDKGSFLVFLRNHPVGATDFLLAVLNQMTRHLYNTALLAEAVVGLEQVGSAMQEVDDLPKGAERLVEQALVTTDSDIGCAVFVWNRFDQSYDLLYGRETKMGPELCRQFAETGQEEGYIDSQYGMVFGVCLSEGGQHLGLLLLECKDTDKAFQRLVEVVFSALARQLSLLVHRHQESRESAALFRLRTRSRWDF